MISIEDAKLILKRELIPHPNIIELPLWECNQRVLAKDIIAPIDVPPYPKSAMDGYAVCSRDIVTASKEHPKVLKVVGELFAGDYKEIPYVANSAIRVMTGSFIPEGYDAIVRQEDTDYGEKEVAIYTSLSSYQNYCKVAEDISKGTLLYSQGTCLNSISIGVLASIGKKYIEVYEPLKISILSTGSELMDLGEPLLPGKTYNSISYIFYSALQAAGYTVNQMDVGIDDVDILQKKVHAMASNCDILITTGGVSVGKKDLLPEIVQALKANILFHGVDMQPGTPMMVSLLEGTPILSFSGNPYAALVNFELFFWDVANQLIGKKEDLQIDDWAILQSDYPKKNKRRRFVRAYEKGGEVFIPNIPHASSILNTVDKCNCFIDLEAGKELKKGEKVRIRYIKSK